MYCILGLQGAIQIILLFDVVFDKFVIESKNGVLVLHLKG